MDKIYIVTVGIEYEGNANQKVFFKYEDAIEAYNSEVKKMVSGIYVSLHELGNGDDLCFKAAARRARLDD